MVNQIRNQEMYRVNIRMPNKKMHINYRNNIRGMNNCVACYRHFPVLRHNTEQSNGYPKGSPTTRNATSALAASCSI
jgi:hypothetical protein